MRGLRSLRLHALIHQPATRCRGVISRLPLVLLSAITGLGSWVEANANGYQPPPPAPSDAAKAPGTSSVSAQASAQNPSPATTPPVNAQPTPSPAPGPTPAISPGSTGNSEVSPLTFPPSTDAPNQGPPGQAAPEQAPPLLAPSQAPTAPSSPAPTRPAAASRSAQSDEQQDDAKRRYFNRLYRPENNPGRIGLGGQIDLALIGLESTGSGGGAKMLHFEFDFGQRWNHIGYTLNAQAFVGSIPLVPEKIQVPVPGSPTGESYPDTVVHRSNVIVGGGARLNMGRLSLLGIGYLDPQLGYVVHYAPTSDAKKNGGKYTAIAPHGPELRVDAGFLSNPGLARKWWQSFGVGVGYQVWVGTFKNKQPITHVMMFGVRYHVQ